MSFVDFYSARKIIMERDGSINSEPKHHQIDGSNKLSISAEEIASITGWTRATVMKKARAGEIPFVPLSKKRGIFLRESFFYWLKNQESDACWGGTNS
jgi:hypothetical protein